MLRFFRTRAPFFGLLLLVALLVTLPGIRHPLPLAGLALFTVAAWVALSRWRAKAAAATRGALSFDDAIARAASDWDARHGAPDDAEPTPDADDADEPWRASLRNDESAWRGEDEAWRRGTD